MKCMDHHLSKYEGWPTTRRYPRTLDEAFPDSIERTEWWYPPEKVPLTVAEWLLWVAAVNIWIGLAYFFSLD